MLDETDYKEPQCPFDFSMWESGPVTTRIPVDRVIAKEDEYLSVNDVAGAEKHLLYWLSEAEAGRDVRGAFSVENELMGLYRKNGREREAFLHAERAVALSHHASIGDGSTAQATALLNAGTVNKAFHRPEAALSYYEQAKAIYERELESGDGRLGGLYNNMALALSDLKRYDEAIGLYEKAIAIMGGVPNGVLEQGMSYLNLCDALLGRDGRMLNDQNEPCDPSDETASLVLPKETDEAIENYLDMAWDCLNDPGVPSNGYYAFVCDTCSGVFQYYGRENEAIALKRMADEIYERD